MHTNCAQTLFTKLGLEEDSLTSKGHVFEHGCEHIAEDFQMSCYSRFDHESMLLEKALAGLKANLLQAQERCAEQTSVQRHPIRAAFRHEDCEKESNVKKLQCLELLRNLAGDEEISV
jgi:hypothetical protein